MSVQDTIVALRSALAPFAQAGKVVEALEEFASIDNWRAEAVAEKDKAVKAVVDAKAELAAVKTTLDKVKADCKEECARLTDDTRAAANLLVANAKAEGKAIVDGAWAEIGSAEAAVGEAKAERDALVGEVAQLRATRDSLVAELDALKARFAG